MGTFANVSRFSFEERNTVIDFDNVAAVVTWDVGLSQRWLCILLNVNPEDGGDVFLRIVW
jgi:hypothetical protein